MNDIIVATDFSDNAQAAVQYALQLAADHKAKLTILHAYEEPVPITEYNVTMAAFESMRGIVEDKLSDYKEELLSNSGYKVQINTQVADSNLLENLNALYAKLQADLLVIGLTGKSQLGSIFMGDHTTHIVNESNCPVLTIPPMANYRPVKKIVFATNFKQWRQFDESDKIDLLKTFQLFNGQISILNTCRGLIDNFNSCEEKRYLQSWLQGQDISLHTIRQHNVVAGIKDFVWENEAELLMMVPMQRGSLNELLHSTHTRRMLFHSNIPLLSLPLGIA